MTLGSEGQIMLTAEGCRARRARLLDRLKPSHALVLADPGHLRYFANFHVEAISQHADVGALLVIRPDGHALETMAGIEQGPHASLDAAMAHNVTRTPSNTAPITMFRLVFV